MVSTREVVGFLALITIVYLVGKAGIAQNGLLQLFDVIQFWWMRIF